MKNDKLTLINVEGRMGLFTSTKKVKIAAQIEAESDSFLFECFHNDGIIEKLVDNRFGIIAGRKGAGKTAIARYLQREHEEYGIDFAHRLTLTDLQTEGTGQEIDGESLLKFLVIRTAQLLSKKGFLTPDGDIFWSDYMSSHGLQDVTSYKDWFVKVKTVVEKGAANVGIKGIAQGDVGRSDELKYEKQIFHEATSTLANRLCESIAEGKKVMILVDDITDHLDHPSTVDIEKALTQVKYVLHQLHNYNTKFNDEDVDLTFICTIRDDLWELMRGSNENKLIHNCLWLEWNEESFCKLLIKRLPHFAENVEAALEKPIESIKEVFPDEIFEAVLSEKGVRGEEVKQFKTKFYSYMQLISFNRPRDFLRLCHAMKTRLSQIKPVELKHIHASEVEYSAYFYNELRDELNIFAKVFHMPINDVLRLLAKFASKSKLSYGELRTFLSGFVKASHAKAYKIINILWNYSLLGLVRPRGYAHFKHNQSHSSGYQFPDEAAIKSTYFILHRGIYWKLQKDVLGGQGAK